MPLLSTNFYAGGPIKAADIIQFFNLFTGVMTDQPVTFANTLTVGGSQSDASVPLRVSSQATGTARVFEARTLQADANPVFGVSRLGVLSFGAGGGTATDTTITRSGVNTLTFSGALTVTGTTMANGQLIAGGGYLQFNGANPQIVGGTATLSLRNNANNADNLLISDAGAVTIRNGLTVTAGAVTVSAGDGNSFRAATSTNSGGDTLIVRPFDDANSGAAQLSVVNAAASVRNWYVTKAGAVIQSSSLTFGGAATPAAGAGLVAISAQTSGSASPGGVTIPTAATFLVINIGGTVYKIPCCLS